LSSALSLTVGDSKQPPKSGRATTSGATWRGTLRLFNSAAALRSARSMADLGRPPLADLTSSLHVLNNINNINNINANSPSVAKVVSSQGGNKTPSASERSKNPDTPKTGGFSKTPGRRNLRQLLTSSTPKRLFGENNNNGSSSARRTDATPSKRKRGAEEAGRALSKPQEQPKSTASEVRPLKRRLAKRTSTDILSKQIEEKENLERSSKNNAAGGGGGGGGGEKETQEPPGNTDALVSPYHPAEEVGRLRRTARPRNFALVTRRRKAPVEPTPESASCSESQVTALTTEEVPAKPLAKEKVENTEEVKQRPRRLARRTRSKARTTLNAPEQQPGKVTTNDKMEEETKQTQQETTKMEEEEKTPREGSSNLEEEPPRVKQEASYEDEKMQVEEQEEEVTKPKAEAEVEAERMQEHDQGKEQLAKKPTDKAKGVEDEEQRKEEKAHEEEQERLRQDQEAREREEEELRKREEERLKREEEEERLKREEEEKEEERRREERLKREEEEKEEERRREERRKREEEEEERERKERERVEREAERVKEEKRKETERLKREEEERELAKRKEEEELQKLAQIKREKEENLEKMKRKEKSEQERRAIEEIDRLERERCQQAQEHEPTQGGLTCKEREVNPLEVDDDKEEEEESEASEGEEQEEEEEEKEEKEKEKEKKEPKVDDMDEDEFLQGSVNDLPQAEQTALDWGEDTVTFRGLDPIDHMLDLDDLEEVSTLGNSRIIEEEKRLSEESEAERRGTTNCYVREEIISSSKAAPAPSSNLTSGDDMMNMEFKESIWEDEEENGVKPNEPMAIETSGQERPVLDTPLSNSTVQAPAVGASADASSARSSNSSNDRSSSETEKGSDAKEDFKRKLEERLRKRKQERASRPRPCSGFQGDAAALAGNSFSDLLTHVKIQAPSVSLSSLHSLLPNAAPLLRSVSLSQTATDSCGPHQTNASVTRDVNSTRLNDVRKSRARIPEGKRALPSKGQKRERSVMEQNSSSRALLSGQPPKKKSNIGETQPRPNNVAPQPRPVDKAPQKPTTTTIAKPKVLKENEKTETIEKRTVPERKAEPKDKINQKIEKVRSNKEKIEEERAKKLAELEAMRKKRQLRFEAERKQKEVEEKERQRKQQQELRKAEEKKERDRKEREEREKKEKMERERKEKEEKEKKERLEKERKEKEERDKKEKAERERKEREDKEKLLEQKEKEDREKIERVVQEKRRKMEEDRRKMEEDKRKMEEEAKRMKDAETIQQLRAMMGSVMTPVHVPWANHIVGM